MRCQSGKTYFSPRRGKAIIWHKKSNSNDPPFWFQLGRNRIRRHMRHMNLFSTRKNIHRKHVPRKILVARPNMMWETDFTKIYIDNEGRVHLTTYLDLCSRKIKGHLVSRMSRTAEMIEAVDNALLGTFQDLNVNGLRIRSDNGSQLTSS